MNGKSKCKILKQIRQQIADENDIAYVTSECKYQGDCAGTCPKCESELQYLENELRKRQAAGKAVAVAGIAATLMLGLTACAEEPSSNVVGGAPPASSVTTSTESDVIGGAPPETSPTTESTDRIELEGDIVLDGDVMLPPEDEEDDVLMGEPVYPPDDELADVPAPPSEDDEPKETLPPFIDKEPGVDTGDWGALH